MKSKYNREWLYKEIARRAFFNKGDVQEILKNIQEIIEELIYLKGEELKKSDSKDRRVEVFKLAGLFTLYLKEIAAHDGWNAVKNERLRIPITYKIVMTPSRSLLNLLKDGYYQEEETASEEDEE